MFTVNHYKSYLYYCRPTPKCLHISYIQCFSSSKSVDVLYAVILCKFVLWLPYVYMHLNDKIWTKWVSFTYTQTDILCLFSTIKTVLFKMYIYLFMMLCWSVPFHFTLCVTWNIIITLTSFQLFTHYQI